MATVLLRVFGMRTAEDEAVVREALEATPGVLAAVASLEDGCAEVDYDDDETELDRLIQAVESAGFQAILGG
ncbi:MAG TPA: heavy-metal-associated domain-containing protein [Longimicrobiales bacterium]